MTQDDILLVDEQNGHETVDRQPGGITDNEDGTKTIYLHRPFEVTYKASGGIERKELVETLTFRRPNGGDMREIAKFSEQFKQATVTFARLCGKPESFFDRLDIDDIALVSEVIESFLAKSPKIGTTSS